MPREHPRSRRVAGQVQRILAEALRGGVRDPRVAGVVLTDVRVATDLATAHVSYTVLDPAVDPQQVEAGLASAAGYLRSRLAQVLPTRTVPELRFRPDESVARGQRLDALIDIARARDNQGSAGGEDNSG